jgi:hypothetical protein
MSSNKPVAYKLLLIQKPLHPVNVLIRMYVIQMGARVSQKPLIINLMRHGMIRCVRNLTQGIVSPIHYYHISVRQGNLIVVLIYIRIMTLDYVVGRNGIVVILHFVQAHQVVTVVANTGVFQIIGRLMDV